MHQDGNGMKGAMRGLYIVEGVILISLYGYRADFLIACALQCEQAIQRLTSASGRLEQIRIAHMTIEVNLGRNRPFLFPLTFMPSFTCISDGQILGCVIEGEQLFSTQQHAVCI